jgi:hypothetical protein
LPGGVSESGMTYYPPELSTWGAFHCWIKDVALLLKWYEVYWGMEVPDRSETDSGSVSKRRPTLNNDSD